MKGIRRIYRVGYMARHNAMPVWRGRPRPRAGSIRAMAMPGFEAVTGGRKKTLP